MNKEIEYENLILFVVSSIKKNWLFYFGATICLIITNYIQSEIPFVARDLALYLKGSMHSFNVWILVLFSVSIVIFRTLSRFLFLYPARLIQYEMRNDFFQRLQSCIPWRYQNISKGQLFQLVISDINELRAFLGFATLQVLNTIIMLFVLIPKLYNFDRDLLISLLPIFLSVIIFMLITYKNEQHFSQMQKIIGDIQQMITESYIGKKTIKNYHKEKQFVNKFNEQSQKELDHFWTISTKINIAMPLLELGVPLSFLWGSYIILEKNLGVESLVLFSGFVFLFLSPMMFLAWISHIFLRSRASRKRLNKFFKSIKIKSDLEQELASINTKFDQKILFWQQSFSLVFDSKIVAIVGQTGVGKSFVLEQLAYLLKTKKRLSFCAQNPYIFDDTLLNNIQLGMEDGSKINEVLELIKLFELNDLLAQYNHEALLNLILGENGKRISGGQAKRVALIRSLLSESEVLIWDDPFSSIDVIQEKNIWNNLIKNKYFLNKKLLIFTTHRLTTLNYAQQIYFLDREKISIDSVDHGSNILENFFEEQMV